MATNGNTIHVAFVGDNTSGNVQAPSTKLFYAAVNGAADLTKQGLDALRLDRLMLESNGSALRAASLVR